MKVSKVLILSAQIALCYNSVILLGVAMDYEWVRTRAAGGQFTEFPIWLRAIYFLMTIAMITLLFILHDWASSPSTERRIRLARALAALFAVSTLMQLISRSVDERWNAIPAALIAVTFFLLAKEKSARQ